MLKKIYLFIILGCLTFAQGEKGFTDANISNSTESSIKLEIEEETKISTSEAISLNIEEPVEKYNFGEPNFQRLKNQTKSISIFAVGTMGVLYLLPGDFTGWDKAELKGIGSKYKNNLTNRGVVWDPDNIFFNFVAHPYVGAVYYIAARKSGYDEFHSFLYSFAMSSFFWEMGIEGFAEAPSIQDIIITPGIGSILGEFMLGVENKILLNDGKVGNSKFIGKTTLMLIDPIGTLANQMGYKDNDVQGSWTVMKNKENNYQLAYNLEFKF